MTQIIDEQLSALFDGELPVEQEAMLLRRLERDPESRDKLARYGLIGELVRDVSAQSSSAPVSAGVISERVSAALTAETMPSETVAPTLSPAANSFGLVGAAIAASIALVVMFNLTGMGNVSPVPGVTATNLVAHDDHVSSPRLTRYLVSHAQFSNSASRQLVDSHVAMAAVSPAAWSGYE
jgi:negative regulator of sigma E activity